MTDISTSSLPPLDQATARQVFRAVCDIPSVSGSERRLADAVEKALQSFPHLRLDRDGDAVVARTDLGREQRVVLAGHLDTVPVRNNLPTREEIRDEEPVLWGRGTVDMKGGVAVLLHLAATLREPRTDVSYVFYDHEEVEASKNGLGRIARHHPEWLAGDFAILGEPTSANIEGGCNGTIRVEITSHGKTAHSARAWRGRNAVHALAPVLTRLAEYVPQTVDVDGLAYREGLNAVGLAGGIATNMIPDAATVTVNYRFAPSRTIEEAEAHVRDVFTGIAGLEFALVDQAPGARPGLDRGAAQEFVRAAQRATGADVLPKYGWTDVARFAELGIPAVNFGPGDANLAHADDEFCRLDEVDQVAAALRGWLEPDHSEETA